MNIRRARVSVGLALGLVGHTGTAGATGPALSVPPEELRRALACPAVTNGADSGSVLLVHGAASSGEGSFGEGYLRILPAAGFHTCALSLPDRGLGSPVRDAELVAGAVRLVRARFGRRVSILGVDEGVAISRWAIRWWPNVGATVDDLISLGGLVKGHPALAAGCGPQPCPEWAHAMGEASPFMRAASTPSETPPPVDATAIFTETDDVIQPPAVAQFDPAPNAVDVGVEDLCPGRSVGGHVGLLYDGAVYGVVLDALRHPGPASVARLPDAACDERMPGVDPTGASVRMHAELLQGSPAVLAAGAPGSSSEPKPLPAYVGRSSRHFGRLRLTARPRRFAAGRPVVSACA